MDQWLLSLFLTASAAGQLPLSSRRSAPSPCSWRLTVLASTDVEGFDSAFGKLASAELPRSALDNLGRFNSLPSEPILFKTGRLRQIFLPLGTAASHVFTDTMARPSSDTWWQWSITRLNPLSAGVTWPSAVSLDILSRFLFKSLFILLGYCLISARTADSSFFRVSTVASVLHVLIATRDSAFAWVLVEATELRRSWIFLMLLNRELPRNPCPLFPTENAVVNFTFSAVVLTTSGRSSVAFVWTVWFDEERSEESWTWSSFKIQRVTDRSLLQAGFIFVLSPICDETCFSSFTNLRIASSANCLDG